MNISTICKALTIWLCCLVCAYAYAQDRPEYVRGQVLIKMKENKTAVQKDALKTQINATKQRSLKNDLEVWQIDETNGKVDIKQLTEQYRNHPDIEFVEPNYYYYLADANYDTECIEDAQNLTPNDPDYDFQWGLHNTGQTGGINDADIDAPEGWNIVTGSPSIKVAIIDSGMDWAHQDLAENVWQNLGEDADGDGRVLEYSQGEWIFDPGDDNGIDDDSNGYVDDFIGWDFVHNDNDPRDTNGHGTHVAGILGAKGDNDKGISGITWDVQMIPIRIFGRFDNQGAPADSIISALNYAVSMGATISNNSWGGGKYSQAMEQAIQNAANLGHLFIAAAGNDGLNNDQHPYYPATYNVDNIISVAAIDHSDQLSDFSHYGATTVHIAAPGVAIWSSIPVDGYESRLGTSMATPHVSGAVALLWGLHHDRSYLEIKDAIINSAAITVPLVGKCVANGRLNLYDALSYFGAPPPPMPPPLNPCRESDSLALVAVYNVDPTGIGWDLIQPMDTWNGVNLNVDGCVNYLYIYNRLSGNFPIEITHLSSLETLYLPWNDLSTLPPEIGDLTSLKELYLNNNNLTTLPAEINSLVNLNTLHLGYNDFTTFPIEIVECTNLRELRLYVNDIMVLPVEIDDLINLSYLSISNNNLTALPIEIWNLTDLRYLDLYNNNLTVIPPEISNLVNLNTLSLSDNNSLVIPAELWELINLKDLYLRSINLTTLPPEVGNLINLESLELENTNLSVLPSELWSLAKLDYLDLSQNNLSSISTQVGNLANLYRLYLDGNNLTNIPSEIGDLNWLRFLGLSDNQFNNIPTFLGNVKHIKHLYFQDNAASGCFDENLINMCGKLDSWGVNNHIGEGNSFDATWSDFCDNGMGVCLPLACTQDDSLSLVSLYNSMNGSSWTNKWTLTEPISTWHGVTFNIFGCIQGINLSSNGLNGTIPAEIGNLINLEYLNLGDNQIGGTIPAEIVNLTQLRSLSLYDNQLIGNIPSGIDNMGELSIFNLFDNQLNGTIPVDIGEARELSILNLSDNFLSGDIPSELGQLIKLDYLNLSDNLLTGSIPYSFGSLRGLDVLALHYNQLTGSIPYTLNNIYSLDELWLHSNQLSGCYYPGLTDLCTMLEPAFSSNGYISDFNNFTTTWEDFCNNGVNTCDPVWAGDFNFDGTANEEDALHWGLAHGNTGPARQGTSTITDWVANDAEDWTQNVQGVNGKHQDGDGNGIVDGDDLDVLELNFNRIHEFSQPPFINSTIIYRLERNGTYSGSPGYDIYIEDGTGIPVEAHGVALTIDFGILPVTGVEMDILNSSLAPSDTLKIFNESENRLHIALTRTDGANQICDSPVASLIVVMDDLPTDTTDFELRVENGTKIEADGTMEDIVGTSIFDTPPGNGANGPGAFSATVSALHAQCTTYGIAWVTANGGETPYTYQWNTGETIDRITNLTAGIYQVTVADATGESEVFTITVEGQYLPIYDDNGNLIDCIDSTCPTLLTPGGAIPSGTYQADRTINSDAVLTGDTDYKAGETIILKNGFEIPPNTEFSGTIEDCDGN